jgi:probable F420-dependent oxidoreductase
MMEFGVRVGNISRLPVPDAVDRMQSMVAAAEELGYASVWVTDHMVFPTETSSTYLSTPSGRLSEIDPHSNMFEALTVLAAFAGSTRHVRLGTNVLVLPYRHPLLIAKMVATLDALSGGRVIFGVGVGWLKEEFDLFGAATYKDRGALVDEYIKILRLVWSQETPSFEGRWYKFSGFDFAPRPVQQPSIPIWIGGASEAAFRRAASLGDGWHPSHITPDVYAAGAASLQARCQERGRPFDELTLSLSLRIVFDDGIAGDELEFQRPPDAPGYFVGSPRQAVATVRRYQAIGCSHVNINVTQAGAPPTGKAAVEALRVFSQRVVQEFG